MPDLGNQEMKSIKNFVEIDEKIGTAGQPKIVQFPIIANAGYEAVINLAMPDHKKSIATEGAIVSSLGMNYVHIPVEFDSPKPSQVKLFCDTMKSLEDTKVFVHCIMNYRVSAFMYHYLGKVAGLNDEQSKSAMFLKWKPDDVWQQVMTWSKEDIGLQDENC